MAPVIHPPVCSRCGFDTFSMEKLHADGAQHPVNIVYCNGCGAIQGVVPLEEAVTRIAQLSERVRRLAQAIGVNLDMGK